MKRWQTICFTSFDDPALVGEWLDRREQEAEEMRLEALTSTLEGQGLLWLVVISYHEQAETEAEL